MPAGRGTQEAKGEVCKTSIRRFESAPRLHSQTLSIQSKHYTAKFAEIAKVHQVSTTWAPAPARCPPARAERAGAAGERRGSAECGQHLDQTVPVFPDVSFPAGILDIRVFFARLATLAVQMYFLGAAVSVSPVGNRSAPSVPAPLSAVFFSWTARSFGAES